MDFPRLYIPQAGEGKGHLATVYHCLSHSTYKEDIAPGSLFHLPCNTVSSIKSGLLDVIENLEEEKKAYKALGTPHQVPPLTFI